MKYYAAFSFYFPSSLPDRFVIPLQLDLGGIHFEVTAVDNERKSAKGFVEAPVSPARLTLSPESKGLNSTRVPAGVIVPEAADLLHKAKEVISLLSFIADVPVLEARRAFEDRIVPETSRDIDCLRVLGTNEIYHRLEAHPSARTFVHGDLPDDYVERLAGKGTISTLKTLMIYPCGRESARSSTFLKQ